MWDEFGGGFAGFECLEGSATPRHAARHVCVYQKIMKSEGQCEYRKVCFQNTVTQYCHMRVISCASNTSAL